MNAVAVQPRIRKLDPRLVNQIAAGEVIVRPASAIKELLENSLDAGATRIEIAVEEDARSFTVRDDGCGIAREDASLALDRYATSKIVEFEDLAKLSTRGFRGEALAALSSVSRFEILTRCAEEETGTHLRAEGGTKPRIESAGLPGGTTIRVRDLFFNTPARMKFLRAPMVEWGHILKEIVRQSLTRPEVGFSVNWRGKPYLTLAPGQSLRERFAAILPADSGADLLEADHTLHGVRAFGCISSPKTTRRDRRHQYFFANGRPIFARPLTFALQEAYKGLIMTQQFPLAALFLEIPGDELDVNVHPTKEEVRFRNEALVAGAIHRATLEALRKAELVPKFSIPATPGGSFARREIPKEDRVRSSGSPSEAIEPPGFFSPASPPEYGKPPVAVQAPAMIRAGDANPTVKSDAPPGIESYADEVARGEATLIERLLRDGHKPVVLGQAALTYIMADAPGLGVLLVDQHAAHEKILYLERQGRKGKRDAQDLLVPYTYEAAASERPALEALRGALAEEGFALEPFGGGTFVVQSLPAMFDKMDVVGFLRDLLGEIGQGDVKKQIERLRHRIGAMAACRAAVKAGDSLSREQMQTLLDQVMETTEALRCPHGRPTMLLLTREQLDRQFGRI